MRSIGAASSGADGRRSGASMPIRFALGASWVTSGGLDGHDSRPPPFPDEPLATAASTTPRSRPSPTSAIAVRRPLTTAPLFQETPRFATNASCQSAAHASALDEKRVPFGAPVSSKSAGGRAGGVGQPGGHEEGRERNVG